MAQTVADLLVGVLEQIGVKHIFALIGDSLNPLADAIRRSRIEWIGVRHEEGAALAAAGQAKLTGQLAVCAGTTGPGSNHLVAGLYEASRDHAPVLALSGDMPRKLHGIDFIQTTEPDLLFRDVSLYTETVSSPAQAPTVIHQAIAAAYAGRGVAHLTLPQDVIAAKAEGAVSSVATLRPRPELAAREADIVKMARLVDQAGSVVIMCGAGCHAAADVLRALSDWLKAPLVHSVKGKDIMPYDDPRWMGGVGMIGTKAAYNAVMHCDMLLMVGTDYPYSNFLPTKGTVVQLDERPQALGRRAPTVLGVVGSARPSLKLLLDRVAPKDDTSFWDKVTKERRRWDEMLDKQADPARSKERIHPQAVARAVSDPRQAQRGLHPRHGSEHTLVRQLDPAKWITADYRFLQQRCRGHGAWSGQRGASARSLAPGDRSVRRWRIEHAYVRISDRGASQAAGEGGDLQQFGFRADPVGSGSRGPASVPARNRISQS